jgi:CheY-like chemotaxis protein
MTASRILVAEDDPASLDLLRAYLESKGYMVGAAPDGNRALEMAASGEFDLLILDVHMPLYGGQEVLTADTRWALRDEMMADGVDGYLLKPVSLSELGKELTRLLPAKRKP